MDVCCWNLNICNTEIKPYYNQQVLWDWEGNLVKKPRGECKVNVYESGVIGMIELIEMKWKGRLEWLDDLDALNQLKRPSRFADAHELLLFWGYWLSAEPDTWDLPLSFYSPLPWFNTGRVRIGSMGIHILLSTTSYAPSLRCALTPNSYNSKDLIVKDWSKALNHA